MNQPEHVGHKDGCAAIQKDDVYPDLCNCGWSAIFMTQKPPRRMLQPTKDELRRRMAVKDEELERLRAQVIQSSRPWWRRLATTLAKALPAEGPRGGGGGGGRDKITATKEPKA